MNVMVSNYNKSPRVHLSDTLIWNGWNSIAAVLLDRIAASKRNRFVLVVDCYVGVLFDEILNGIKLLDPEKIIDARLAFKSENEIIKLTYPDVTDDAVFGFRTNLQIMDFFSAEKIIQVQQEITEFREGLLVVYGPGASLIPGSYDLLIYADMARWEIQNRMKKGMVHGLGVDDHLSDFSVQYKRGYFVDWRVCDNHKKTVIKKADYFLDTNTISEPKMLEGKGLIAGLHKTSLQPFRVVPFFDPGPWGGQWMKEVCDLDRNVENYAWCFDCVPEENSLLFEIDGVVFETPSINLIFLESKNILGDYVEAMFGQEFPIRFDFLDTMDGGNLSFQVHPTNQYIKETFGMQYTQDESYYMLEAKEGGKVYLGLKNDACPETMLKALRDAQNGGQPFIADEYVNSWKAQKHDHFLIPAGTVHCSGKDCMVLEISATPYIFTFKMWDWDRLGLDGKPRPINIDHAEKVIDWSVKSEKVSNELVNSIQLVSEGDGWREEQTGLHRSEFIETRRHWFTKKVFHKNNNGVNVLNLVEGPEAIVESPEGRFEPFIVHYAETFIIPAAAGDYTIGPHGAGKGKQLATIKAYVREK